MNPTQLAHQLEDPGTVAKLAAFYIGTAVSFLGFHLGMVRLIASADKHPSAVEREKGGMLL